MDINLAEGIEDKSDAKGLIAHFCVHNNQYISNTFVGVAKWIYLVRWHCNKRGRENIKQNSKLPDQTLIYLDLNYTSGRDFTQDAP